MAVIGNSTYSINFTSESLKNVSAELDERADLRRNIYKEINHSLKILTESAGSLPEEVRGEIALLQGHIWALDHESLHTGRAHMYQYIGNNIPTLLPRIILRLMKELKIPATRERIKEAVDWSVLKLIESAKRTDTHLAKLAREYKIDKSYFTKAKSKPIAQAFLKFEMMRRSRKHTVADNPIEDIRPDQSLPFTSKHHERMNELKEGSEDWVVAEKMFQMGLHDNALAFLRTSKLTEKSIRKFQRMMTDKL